MQISIDQYRKRRKAGQFAGKDEKVINIFSEWDLTVSLLLP